MELQDVYTIHVSNLARNKISDKKILEKYQKIKSAYSSDSRFYHTLQHLSDVICELQKVETIIENLSQVMMAVFYHDIVYNVNSSDSEAESAEFASAELEDLNIPVADIENCKRMILATKDHTQLDNNDLNLFLDADLTILGSDRETYQTYLQNIRKEYSIYTDQEFNAGRKKVLSNLLKRQKLYKTSYFQEKYESKARENLSWEIQSL